MTDSFFSTQDVHERIGGLAGKPAEEAFLKVMAAEGYELGVRIARWGFDGFDTSNRVIATLPAFIRHAPDFVQVGGHMWEAQGCGEDRMFVFKKDKLESMWMWHALLLPTGRELRWALYVQPDEVLYRSSFDHVLWAIQTHGEYHEEVVPGKDGWLVPVSAFDYGLVLDYSDAFRALKKEAARGEAA